MPLRSELTSPWRPGRVTVYGSYPARTTRRGREVVAHDLRFEIDGHQFSRRFNRKGEADTFGKQLDKDFVAGRLFDPQKRVFVEAGDLAPAAPTVLSTTEAFVNERWPGWSPKSRREAVRYLNHARRGLLRDGAPEPPSSVTHYLQTASLRPETEMDERAAEGRAWLEEWSVAVNEVTPEQARALVQQHAGDLAAASQRRMLAALRAWWRQLLADGHVTRDVFANVKLTGQGKRKASGVQPVDADLVLTPRQVLELADAMPSERDAVLVLVMGYAGLRGGEAVGLTRDDLSSDERGRLWIRVRRSARSEAKQWRAASDDPAWGPAKHRDEGDARYAPIPAVPVARRVGAFADTRPAGALLFTHAKGKRLDRDVWRRRVWAPVRDELFGDDDRLAQLTPHDLRHAAATMWLQAGVSLPLARRWGGWASTSVLLDVSAGVMPSEDADALDRVEQSLFSASTEAGDRR